MKKNIRRAILLLALFCLLVPMLTGCGKNMDESISIEVKSIEQGKDGAEITLSTRNNTGHDVALGWVGTCEFEVTTDQDTYYYKPHNDEIPRGKDTITFWVKGYEGELEKLVITELCLLNERGLPGKKMQDVVVFDESEDIDGFEDTFGFSFSTVNVMAIVMPILMVSIVATVIVIAICTHRRNMEAARQFNPYGPAPVFNPDDQAMQMHAQACRMHEQAHQQVVHQEQVRINTELAHQSVTPIDQGGFVPPPMPPMGM